MKELSEFSGMYNSMVNLAGNYPTTDFVRLIKRYYDNGIITTEQVGDFILRYCDDPNEHYGEIKRICLSSLDEIMNKKISSMHKENIAWGDIDE